MRRVVGSLLGVAAVLLPAVALTGPSGCGQTACFAYSPSLFSANGNSCPAPGDALQNFTNTTCPGPVVAVDGAGSFDGQLCCYPVTEDSIVADCGGGGSTPTSCTTCAAALTEGASSCSLDGAAGAALAALEECIDGGCPESCAAELANGTWMQDATCRSCAQSVCPAPLAECATQ